MAGRPFFYSATALRVAEAASRRGRDWKPMSLKRLRRLQTRLGHPLSSADAGLQHFLQPRRPDPLAPARHHARIDWHLVLEEFEATEKLPVWVSIHDQLLIRQVVK